MNILLKFLPQPGQIHHQDLAPEHFLRDRGHLSGHPEGQLGRGDDAADGAAVAAGPARRGRTGRPAGRGRGDAVQGQPRDVHTDGQALDERVRRWAVPQRGL